MNQRWTCPHLLYLLPVTPNKWETSEVRSLVMMTLTGDKHLLWVTTCYLPLPNSTPERQKKRKLQCICFMWAKTKTNPNVRKKSQRDFDCFECNAEFSSTYHHAYSLFLDEKIFMNKIHYFWNSGWTYYLFLSVLFITEPVRKIIDVIDLCYKFTLRIYIALTEPCIT